MSIFKSNNQENIIIAGCGNFGSYLANLLCQQDDNVSMIDLDDRCFLTLSKLSIDRYIKGDATDTDILELAGIKSADVLIAATNSDNVNIMISQIAKKIYSINNVITVIQDFEKGVLCSEMEINVISPLMLSANQLRKVLISEMK